MRWLAIFVFAVAAVAATPAAAQLIPGKIICKYDPHPASYLPDWDKKTLAGGYIHICHYTYDGHNEAEYVLPPVKTQGGVCVVQSIPVYLVKKDGHLVQAPPTDKWKFWHPHRRFDNPLLAMQPAAGRCPAADKGRYIEVHNVPPGIFARLVRLWRGLLANPAEFDKRFALVPEAERQPDAFEHLRTLLTAPSQVAKLRLDTIALSRKSGIGGYWLMFNDPGYRNRRYALSIDWVDGGFKIIGIHYIMI